MHAYLKQGQAELYRLYPWTMTHDSWYAMDQQVPVKPLSERVPDTDW